MKRSSWFLDRLCLAFAIVAGANLLLLALIVFLDVFGRYLFNRPMPFAVELIELLVAVVVMGGLPLTTFLRGHVAVDLIESVCSPAISRLLSLFSLLVTLGFVVLLGWQCALRAEDLAETGIVTAILGIPVSWVVYFATLASAATILTLIASLFGVRSEIEASEEWE